MTNGAKKIETHCIEWRCGRCHDGARIPSIPIATIADVRDAITRGHERRSPACHERHGIKHVRAEQDGRAYRFTSPTPAPSTASSSERRPLHTTRGPMYAKNTITGLQRAVLALSVAEAHARTTVGPSGGTISIPRAGLTVTIPPDALTTTSTVTLTAHAKLHAFAVELDPPQPLGKRAEILITLEPGHKFGDATSGALACANLIDEEVVAKEFFLVKRDGDVLTAKVPHFSGYIMSGGLVPCDSFPCDPDGSDAGSCTPQDPSCVWVDDGE